MSDGMRRAATWVRVIAPRGRNLRLITNHRPIRCLDRRIPFSHSFVRTQRHAADRECLRCQWQSPPGAAFDMHRATVASLVAVLAFATACQSPALPATSPQVASDNAVLTELGREDQDNQMGKEVKRTDQDRVVLVLEQIGAGKVSTAADRFNAAIVLQHSPMTFRNDALMGVSLDNYLLGHHLAKAAFDDGYAAAKELVAQSIDRYLSLTTGIQKYGTNRFINQKTGKEELAPIDRATTDAERARYGVPPLADLLTRYSEAPVGGRS